MTATVYKLTTANSTNLNQIKAFNTNLKGIAAVNTAAYEIFVKFYWFLPTASAAAPTVGTTIPDITIAIPALGTTTGGLVASWQDGISKNGQLWIAVTKLAANTDTTSVAANDGLISVFYE